MVLWRLKSCCRCRGDLVLEEGLWRCFQCGLYYYTDLFQPGGRLPNPDSLSSNGQGRKGKRKPVGGMAGRNINSVVRAQSAGEKKWWERNRQVITYLDEGRTVREIAALTARGRRQVRIVREKLADCRAQAEALRS